MNSTIAAALKIMGLGLGGVFVILILFYLVTKLIIVIARKLPPTDKE
jgi:hypothetical protein